MTRPSLVDVPELGGLAVTDAEDAVLDAGLLPHIVAMRSGAACPDRRASAVVCGQDPRPHARREAGALVCFWCAPPDDDPPGGGGGGGGSKLPWGPKPLSPTGSKPF